MTDTDPLNTQEALAATAIGESENLGETGMQETINTAMNRAKANREWMGGSDVRSVCLAHDQYDVWWPQTNNPDRQRVLDIALKNPSYGPYVVALGLSARAVAGDLPDITNGAVSYYDSDECDPPDWSIGKPPCHINGLRIFFNLAAVEG
ncbi:MAG: hypothetical protein WAL34_04115 [Acidobacteriaceae bacterium]